MATKRSGTALYVPQAKKMPKPACRVSASPHVTFVVFLGGFLACFWGLHSKNSELDNHCMEFTGRHLGPSPCDRSSSGRVQLRRSSHFGRCERCLVCLQRNCKACVTIAHRERRPFLQRQRRTHFSRDGLLSSIDERRGA